MIGKGDQGRRGQLDGSGDIGQLQDKNRWNIDKGQVRKDNNQKEDRYRIAQSWMTDRHKSDR